MNIAVKILGVRTFGDMISSCLYLNSRVKNYQILPPIIVMENGSLRLGVALTDQIISKNKAIKYTS